MGVDIQFLDSVVIARSMPAGASGQVLDLQGGGATDELSGVSARRLAGHLRTGLEILLTGYIFHA
jgi:hypothetical protein